MHPNKLTVSLIWSLFFWVVDADARPAQYTIKATFSQSEIAVVATLQRVTRVSEVRMSGSTPKGLANTQPRYACEVTLKTDFYIKGTQASNGKEVSAMMYSHRADCRLEAVRGQDAPVNIAVWFLRRENGIYRSVVDNMMALVPIGSFSDHLRQEMSKLSEPSERLAVLLLSPGSVYDAPHFAKSSFGLTREVLGLCGWESYIKVLRILYISSGPDFQRQICLILSRGAMCIDCAREAAVSVPDTTKRVRYPYLSQERFAEFEIRELQWLDVATLQELRRKSGALALPEIRDFLVRDACTSSLKLRNRARLLVERFFGLYPEDLPCVPCR